MLRSIEGVNITRNNSCYSFLKEEIFQFYKAIGCGYSSEKDVLSWICFLTWQIDKNAHDPGEVDENRSFLVVSLHDRSSGWSFLGSMRTVSETAHTKKNLSLIVCLSLKWSVKWFRIADFTTIVRKLDRFINHTLFGCGIRGLIQVINNYDTTPTIRVFSSSLIYFCRITMSDMVGGGDGGREVSGEGRAGKVLSTFVRLNDADLVRRWAPARLQGTILKKRLLCLDPAEKMIMCRKGTHCYVFLWNYHDTKTLQAGASQKFEFRTFI